jgi:hypothetical protein
MTGILRVPRSRGALSGVLLILLGAWGALIAFIGPYFNYAYTPDRAWVYNSDRLWLQILPGAATLLGGLIVLVAATRPVAVFGAWLAALGGAWFVVGMPLSTLWTSGGTPAGGTAVGGTVSRAMENIGFFTGLGVVIIFFAALALGRFTVIGVREATRAEAEPEPAGLQPAAHEGMYEPAPRPGTGTDVTQPGATTQTADQPAGMTATHSGGRPPADGGEPPA